MNKKYTIVNINSNESNFCIDYFFYIVIFILAIYLVIQFMSINYKDNFSNYKENFESTTLIPNATNCDGWKCSIEGQVCPQGTPGASDGTYICQNSSWVKNNAVNSTAEAQSLTVSNGLTIGGSIGLNPLNNLTVTDSVVIGNNATSETSQVLTIEQQLQEAKTQNNALKMSKETLEESMRKQARALFLANNFYRIDNSSFNNEIKFINDDFVDIRLPESEFTGKTIISTQQEWSGLLAKANEYKNLYKTGDVVIKPSDYNISKDTICYKDYETNLSNDPNFKKKYPECMVCSINPDTDYKNTKSWINTKTNIHKVCLFNPNASNDSSILNYNGCKNLCSLK